MLIGHAGHPEVVGTMGQLPEGAVTPDRDGRGSRALHAARSATTRLRDPDHAVGRRHRRHRCGRSSARFPSIAAPHKEDICYATTNRQEAVKRVAPQVDALVVVGAPNSSNSRRLQEVAERAGCRLCGSGRARGRHRLARFDGVETLGVTAGASAPEVLVEEILDAFAPRYTLQRRNRVRPRMNPDMFFPVAAASFARAGGGGARRIGRLHRRYRRRPGRFLAGYDLGELLSYKGIAEGVENSNFLVHAGAGHFILTLYEKRVAAGDLPFFLALMEHLAARGITCPQPVKNRDGETLGRLCGRPAAIVTFLDGLWMRRPDAGHCAAVGEALARLHLAGADFAGKRDNALSVAAGGRCTSRRAARADKRAGRACAQRSRRSWRIWRRAWPRDLPQGVIHADLFPDNVFFLGDKLSGPDRLLFRLHRYARLRRRDLPQRLVLRAGPFLQRHQGPQPAAGLRAACGRCRPPSLTRCRCWRAARRMRFLLTRLVDWLNVPAGALVRPKDPLEYYRKLRFHQKAASVRDYGLR